MRTTIIAWAPSHRNAWLATRTIQALSWRKVRCCPPPSVSRAEPTLSIPATARPSRSPAVLPPPTLAACVKRRSPEPLARLDPLKCRGWAQSEAAADGQARRCAGPGRPSRGRVDMSRQPETTHGAVIQRTYCRGRCVRTAGGQYPRLHPCTERTQCAECPAIPPAARAAWPLKGPVWPSASAVLLSTPIFVVPRR